MDVLYSNATCAARLGDSLEASTHCIVCSLALGLGVRGSDIATVMTRPAGRQAKQAVGLFQGRGRGAFLWHSVIETKAHCDKRASLLSPERSEGPVAFMVEGCPSGHIVKGSQDWEAAVFMSRATAFSAIIAGICLFVFWV